MDTPIIPSLQQSNHINKWFLCCCFALLSIYPIYRNLYYSNGLLTYERHRAVIEKRSEFYNPWQYRVLCPYTIEGLLWLYNHTVDKVYPVEAHVHISIQSNSGITDETDQLMKLLHTPGAMKYMIIFIFFRFIEHIFVFFLAWKLWSFFIKSKWLIFLAINFLALAMGNAVAVADLSFNTYMDIILYLLTANIIVYKKNAMMLLPITVLAAFNRETGILIPALYFISQTDFTNFSLKKINVKGIVFPAAKTWLYTALLYVIFIGIFVGLRMYFGYQPQQEWKAPAGLPMLKLNLFSATGLKAYMELIGTFGVLPLIILYTFKQYPYLLRKWFLFVVPIWFAVHYVSVVAYQTRLFLVPITLIMLPMILILIEHEISARYSKNVN